MRFAFKHPDVFADMVATGRAEPLPDYVNLIQAARYLGHGRPDLQAELPVYWTTAAILVSNAEQAAQAEEGA